jgi:terminase small subunit / prophage DNA-packing protein
MVDVSIEQLAALLDISSTAVSTNARRGILIRSKARGKFNMEASVRNYCRHLREQAAGRKTGDVSATDRDRLAKAQREAIEQKTAMRAGKLLDAEAVENEWCGIARVIRAGILRIPRRVGDRAGLTAEQVRMVDDEVRACLSWIGAAQDGQVEVEGGMGTPDPVAGIVGLPNG